MKWLLCVVALTACSKKTGDTGTGSAAVPPPRDAAAVVVAVDAAAPKPPPPPDASTVESKYGYCELTFTGAINDTTRVALDPQWVSSDYWLSAKTKAQDAKADAEIKKQGYTYDEIQKPFGILCEDSTKGWFVHINTSENTKLSQIKQKPQDLPIEYHTKKEQKPGQVIGEILTSLTSLYASTGTLHITRFEKGELEATFEIESASIREPPDKVKIVGKIVYHCADYDRCGRL